MHPRSPEGEGKGRKARQASALPRLAAQVSEPGFEAIAVEFLCEDLSLRLLQKGVFWVIAFKDVEKEAGRQLKRALGFRPPGEALEDQAGDARNGAKALLCEARALAAGEQRLS